MELERSYLISVILPAYNAEKTVAEAVRSVLSQSYTNFELIIIDDASSDGTKAIIEDLAEKDTRIRVISNEKNLGVLKTRLKGIRSAFGKWIAFIDSDDMWAKDKLAEQVAVQQKTASYLVFTGTAYIDSSGNTLPWEFHVPSDVDYKKLLKQNVIPNSSVMVMKDVFLRYTPVNEDHRDIHEDFACWLSMLREGYRVSGIDAPLVTYRLSKNSMTGNKLHSAVLNWYTYRFTGLNVFQTAFYMVSYMMRNVVKYSHLKQRD